ncbi:fibroblast growth factor receptor 1-like [Ptychodera flava]|uniref:fibroblast growth factor receptor 1-like n=1 Tax=Ptychodera flava TaxID=63121 RepID=UPI003969BD5A
MHSIVSYCYRGRHYGFKTIVDTEFDSFIEELFHEHPDLDTWVLRRKDIKVRKEIGFGEFGKSELAELRRGNGTLMVALKSLITNRRHCLSISYRDFCHEIACLKRLHGHPNIISLLGIVVSGDPKYIVVEYAARGDLLSYLQGLRSKNVSRLEEGRLVRIARDVTLALQYLEENMVIHRDIASRNVLIMEDYVAKIGDFGLSRDIYETGKYCKDKWSQLHGPLPLKWMSPEFLQVGVHDQKSDIWSYGVLLWEIATLGEPPFTNVPATEIVRFLLDGQRLGQPENCTDRLYNVMLRCWRLKPIDRPNAKDLTDHLEELSRNEERFFTDIVPDLLELEV